MSGYREEVKPASNAGKVIILLLGLTLLAVLIGMRFFSSADLSAELPQETTETATVPTEVAQNIAPTQAQSTVVEPVATIDNSLAPSITAATISPSENGDQLNLSGTADITCGQVIGYLDGFEIGTTTPTASSTWSLIVPAPDVGRYDAVMKCVTSEGEFSAAPIKIEVPENIPTPAPEVSETVGAETPIVTDTIDAETPLVTDTVETEAPIVTDTVETEAPVVTETVEAEETPIVTDTVEVTPPPAVTVDQPDYTFANKMEDWIGGPLLVRGSAEANSEVELIFDNGVQPVTATAITNAEGRYAARVILTEVGEYAVTVQYAGTQAQPTDTVIVPPDVNYGSRGNCSGTVPPFGRIDGDVYIVNDCEYFSLIANRLGVSYRDLLNVNRNIFDVNRLRVGDRIQIPPLP